MRSRNQVGFLSHDVGGSHSLLSLDLASELTVRMKNSFQGYCLSKI